MNVLLSLDRISHLKNKRHCDELVLVHIYFKPCKYKLTSNSYKLIFQKMYCFRPKKHRDAASHFVVELLNILPLSQYNLAVLVFMLEK